MTKEQISELLSAQKQFFKSGKTLPVSFRKAQLKRLSAAIKAHESEILSALTADLGKSPSEGYMCEVGLTLSEIGYMLSHLRRFARPRRVSSPLAQFPSKSYVLSVPYGNVLIMSPWNYPFLLTIEPLVNAIAAGNCAIVKPSAYSPKTAEVISKLISECFPPEYVTTVTGGRAENSALLDLKFDKIFFTGSQSVGKEVLRRAAEHLTPAVLELGGKSPCIVDNTADIPLAARRIVFGKLINCGQTCVAPDYILCHKSVCSELCENIISEIKRQLGDDPLKCPSYGRIVNEKHFDRLLSLIDPKKTLFGGGSSREQLRIAPTVMSGVSYDDPVMGEEIFGPILPILTYEDTDALIASLKEKESPLALYIFSKDKNTVTRVTREVPYGGGCVNDVVIHLATSRMGFGGVGPSGMGAYHGKVGFDEFSHKKSIVDKNTRIDLPMRYQPYTKKHDKMIRFFLK